MNIQTQFVKVVRVIFPDRMTSQLPKTLRPKIPNKDLTLFTKENLLSLKDSMGKYIAVLGLRGTGKSNTGAVIVEELLSNNVPVTIIDIDGEHRGLRDKFPIEIKDWRNPIKDVKSFVDNVLKKNKAVLLDFSNFSAADRDKVLNEYLNELWNGEDKYRIPHFVVVEESHEFIPQSKNTPVKEILTRIALRGRKKGLGAVLISQRSAKVDKDVLSQADIYLLHKVVHPSDMGVYKEIIPLESKEVQKIITSLKTGDAIYLRDGKASIVRLRKRETKHGGHTPGLDKIRPLSRRFIPW